MTPRFFSIAFALAAATLCTVAAAAPTVFDTGSWERLRKAHAGKPVVVHFWGVTCAPCLVELPEWAKLERALPGTKVVYVQAEQHPPAKGAQTLAKAGLAKSEQWSFAQGASEERLRYEVDPRWRGELPRTLLITADGNITTQRDGTDFAKIREWAAAQPR